MPTLLAEVDIIVATAYSDLSHTQMTFSNRRDPGRKKGGSGPSPEEAGQVANCGGAARVDPGDPHGDAQHVRLRVVIERPAQDERHPVEQRDLNGRAGETGDGGHDGTRGRAVEDGPAGGGCGSEDGVEQEGAAALGEEKTREVVLEREESYAIEDGGCSWRSRCRWHSENLVEEWE
jgi:hypothetical protein